MTLHIAHGSIKLITMTAVNEQCALPLTNGFPSLMSHCVLSMNTFDLTTASHALVT
jgi:hypothetical protein